MLFHFVKDGYTHGAHVYLRGEHIDIDPEEAPAFKMTPNEQVKTLGDVYFKKGPWDGALIDTDNPEMNLTAAERSRLIEANQKIEELRKKYEAQEAAKEEAGPDPEKPSEKEEADSDTDTTSSDAQKPASRRRTNAK